MNIIARTADGADTISFRYEGDGFARVTLGWACVHPDVPYATATLVEEEGEALVLDYCNPGSAYVLDPERCPIHPFVTAIECAACVS